MIQSRRLQYPLMDYEHWLTDVKAALKLAVSYSQIREHKKPTEFTKQ